MKSGINAIEIRDKKILFIVLAGIIFLAIMPLSALGPVLLLLLGVMLGVFVITIFAAEDFEFLLNIFLAGFMIRISLSSAFYIFSFIVRKDLIPGFIFSNDGLCYSEQGWQICKFIERGIRVTQENFLFDPNMMVEGARSGNITNYDFFAAFVYSITGKNPLLLFFISSIAGSIAGLFVYFIAKEMFSKKVARISSMLVFFWPSFILWSTQNLKDSAICMFVMMLLWAIIYISKYPLPLFPLFFLFIAVSAWLLFKISPPFAVVVMAGIACSGLFLFIRHLFKIKFISFVAIIIILMALYFYFKDKIFSFIISKTGYNSIFEFLDYNRSVRAYGNLQFLKDFSISSPGKIVLFLPLALLFTLFAPFPWQLGSFMQIIAVPETLIFYLLFPFTLKGVVNGYKKDSNKIIMVLTVIAAVLIFLALVEGNSGTLFRHRSVAFHLLFIFTAFGISLNKKEPEYTV